MPPPVQKPIPPPMQRITKGGWTYKVEQPYYEQFADALRRLAQAVGKNAMFFVQDGPRSLPPEGVNDRIMKIKDIATRLNDVANHVDEIRISYDRYEDLLRDLRQLGNFPDQELVSDVARTLVM